MLVISDIWRGDGRETLPLMPMSGCTVIRDMSVIRTRQEWVDPRCRPFRLAADAAPTAEVAARPTKSTYTVHVSAPGRSSPANPDRERPHADWPPIACWSVGSWRFGQALPSVRSADECDRHENVDEDRGRGTHAHHDFANARRYPVRHCAYTEIERQAQGTCEDQSEDSSPGSFAVVPCRVASTDNNAETDPQHEGAWHGENGGEQSRENGCTNRRRCGDRPSG